MSKKEYEVRIPAITIQFERSGRGMKCPYCFTDLIVKKKIDEFNDVEVLILKCPKCGWMKKYVDI
jgi:RNase P subunit RPR2